MCVGSVELNRGCWDIRCVLLKARFPDCRGKHSLFISITVDLMPGYCKIPISKPGEYFTAFVTSDGQYEYNCMPFGSSGFLLRAMGFVLAPARLGKLNSLIFWFFFVKSLQVCLESAREN